MNLEIIRTQTTWNDAAGSINSNYAKIADAIAQLKANGGGGGGGADIDLTDYATKVWVEAKGYITASTLTPYALKTDIPSLVGYATEDFVNNQLGDYATKDYVTTKLVNYAPLTSVQGFENRIGGLEGAVPRLNERVDSNDEQIAILNETTSGHTTSIGTLTQRADSVEQLAATKLDSSYFTLANIKSTLGISDWALAATKPSYAWSEITSRPTALSQFTDDVVAGKYLPLSGGTLSNAAWRGQLTIERSGSTNDSVIAFTNSNGLLGCLGYRGADGIPCVWLGETNTGTPIIHANNIGSYNAGSADILATSFRENINYTSGESSLKLVRYVSDWESNGFPTNYSAGLSVMTNYTGWQLLSYGGNIENPYFRSVKDDGVWKAWRQIAFLTGNVASATKLQTPRTLWGQSFDGTNNISGAITLGGDLNNAAGGIYIHNTNEINSFQGKLYLNHRGSGLTDYGSTNDIVMVANGGNVGIGNTSPTERLDVSGNIKASGNINATSITINGVTITASNGSITVNGNVFATGAITAKVVG